jgi:hypothetical protein
MSMPINFGPAPVQPKQDQPWQLIRTIRDPKLEADPLAHGAATA